MRIFYALTIEDSEKEKIYKLSKNQRLKCIGGKFTIPSNYHLTLTFVGDINESDLSKYIDVLKDISSIPNEICIKGYSFFEKKRYILYMNIEKESHLSNLKEKLDIILGEMGFVDQYPEYIPHITIGRNIKEIEAMDKLDKFEIRVKSLALMKSVNDGSGVVYKEVFEKLTYK